MWNAMNRLEKFINLGVGDNGNPDLHWLDFPECDLSKLGAQDYSFIIGNRYVVEQFFHNAEKFGHDISGLKLIFDRMFKMLQNSRSSVEQAQFILASSI